jgi:hypothetical protein
LRGADPVCAGADFRVIREILQQPWCFSPVLSYDTLAVAPPFNIASINIHMASVKIRNAALYEITDDTTWNRPAWLTRREQEITLENTSEDCCGLPYIRPMGGKVPSIYGPSGDDPARQ